MVTYAVEALVQAGVDEVMLVTGGTHAGEFFRLLGNGREYGVDRLTYGYQEQAGGIAEALGLAEHFVARDKVCVMLADNIFERSLPAIVENFEQQASGARIVLSQVEEDEHLRHLGVAEMDGERVTQIVEKPESPPSKYAVTGVYFYDAQVWDVLPTLKPSGRGELEITDVNNWYVERGADGGGRRRRLLGRRGRVDRGVLRGERLRAPQRAAMNVREFPLTLHEDERGWFAELDPRRARCRSRSSRRTSRARARA